MKTPGNGSVQFPRRVLIISPVGEIGGAERVLLDFVASTRTVKPELDFHVLMFSYGPLIEAVRRLGATASVLPLPVQLRVLGDSALLSDMRWKRGARLLGSLARSAPALASFVRTLRREIIRCSPDIVHSNGIKAHLLSNLATPRSLPIVWHIHDFLGERPLARHLLKLVVGRANAAIAISEEVAQATRRSFPSLKVVTILNAVDVDEFSPGSGDGPWLDRLALLPIAPRGTVRIGLVATYARWKGQDVFLRAAALIRSSSPSRALRFYVVGGPLYATEATQFSEQELRSLISELEIADVTGLIPFQEDLPPVLRSLDIIVHASTRPEPFGRTIIEAMACARPVVVAAAGGAAVLVEAGRSGLKYSPGNVPGLAVALMQLVDDPSLRDLLSSEGHRRTVSLFSRARVGPALLMLYQSLRSSKRAF